MKKQIIILLILSVICLMGCSCSDEVDKAIELSTTKDNINNPLTVGQFEKEERVIKYFEEKGLIISDIKLVKRQTNPLEKNDIAYLNIVAENDELKYSGVFKVSSTYYDVGGWQAEDIYSYEECIYEAKKGPTPDIEVEDGTVSVKKEELQGRSYYIIYTCVYEGKYADITEEWKKTYSFDSSKGIWSVDDKEHLSHNVELKLSESEWTYEIKNAGLTTIYADNRYKIVQVKDKIHLVLITNSSLTGEEYVYNLGYSEVIWDEAQEEYYCTFKHYSTSKNVNIMIRPNELGGNEALEGLGGAIYRLKLVGDYVEMPIVVGLSAKEAKNKLDEMGFDIVLEYVSDSAAPDIVIGTSLEEGKLIARGTLVEIYVSSGSEENDFVTVPKLVGLSEEKAIALIEQLGLMFKIVYVEGDGGKVLSTSYTEGWQIPRETVLVLHVGNDKTTSNSQQYNEIINKFKLVTNYGTAEEKTWITLEHITGAQVVESVDSSTGEKQYCVEAFLSENGKEVMADMLGANVGRVLYIMIEGEIISAPLIESGGIMNSFVVSKFESFDIAETMMKTLTDYINTAKRLK